MNYQQGISREQISFLSFESLIASDNPVRVIDAYVDQLDLAILGFTKTTLSKEGRPPYKAADLLKALNKEAVKSFCNILNQLFNVIISPFEPVSFFMRLNQM